ncbi:MAG: hypothetical protein SCALA702_00110 [Melioribacteraceae bacterium]|nr:MAG: hypothetical protein SCALA702_00110 [Melioribacteraceae bacterium]
MCDSFLALRSNNYIAFSRSGSQTGKQKSIKGTPDSFKLMPNGQYIFVEHTTNISNKTKLEDDIRKCLDYKKTRIPLKRIKEIILCANFKLSVQDVDRLKRIADKKKVQLRIYLLDELSIELFYHHRDLTNQYLGLPLDTGQIVSISKFIEEYNKAAKSVATPLDNVFVHRGDELHKLNNSINSSDFIIITGSPGVGKTKLALEGISSFLSKNHQFNAYCVSFKSASLIEDLYQYFDEKKDYILFVDDANRIDSFNQIIGFYKNSRSGKLKIIITVRDYALNDIAKRCYEFKPEELHLKKLLDEQIIDIIKSDSFKIYNPDYHKEIIRIAEGNPRLAIMAAKLAIQEQNLYALSDVSELFEQYFARFISDNVDISKVVNLKSLGLIAFFYTIPYKDKVGCIEILQKYDLHYNDFIESIDTLNKIELVEIQFEYVKISEQNLSTYFFYKSFIKDEVLSFRVLLENYYDSNLDRFRDTIIPANNTFGYQNVIEKVKPILLGYWKAAKVNEEKAFNLLNTFWFYLEEETLEFIYTLLTKIAEPTEVQYYTTYENNQFSYNRDKIISLLGNFFNYPVKLKDALELAFEYARKIPEKLPELIYTIREHLLFDTDDQRMGYKRQEILINLLLEKSDRLEKVYKTSFPAIAISFLQYKYQHTKGGRHHSFYWYNYPFPINNFTKTLREKIWNKIDIDFDNNAEIYTQLLIDYSQRTPDVVKEVMEFDVNYVIRIIKNHLKKTNFQHCHYVQSQINWFVKNDINNDEFDILKNIYFNELYLIYLKMNWDHRRDKESFAFEDYNEYEKLKENEVREYFVFDKLDSFSTFYKQYCFLLKWVKNDYSIKNSFDHIMDENFKVNFELGAEYLEYIIVQNNYIDYVPSLPFQKLLANKERASLIWNIISSKDYIQSTTWRLKYFIYLDEKFVDVAQCKNLIASIKDIKDYTFIHFPDLIKYIKCDANLLTKILRIIVEKRDKEKISIRFTHNFFSKHISYLKTDIKTVKKAYIQQENYDPHYDYGGTELLAILRIDKNFLLEYVDHLYKQKERHRSFEHKNLSVVWLVKDIQKVLTKVLDLIAEREIYLGILDHFCNSFFLEIKKEENIKRSNEFIIGYINANYNDIKKMNMIVDVLRHTKSDFFEEAYSHYLILTQDVIRYSKILWIGNGGSTTGNESLGEKMTLKWRRILEITNKLDLGMKLIPIKKFINDEIEEAIRYSEWEKRRRFLDKF